MFSSIKDSLTSPLSPAPYSAPLLVAEIGGNHGGDLQLAAKMIEAAANAGAGAVKFQAYHTESFLSPLSPYYAELLAEELAADELASLVRYAHSLGLGAGLTVFDQEGLDFAVANKVDFLKISSGDITNYPLLHKAAQVPLPLFVSTGAATEADVRAALTPLAPARDRLTLLQCASLYPAPLSAANLAVMARWQSEGLTVGYSDHTQGLAAARMALALGAAVVEKHFTIDRELPGGDNDISALPEEFSQLAQWSQECAVLWGESEKRLLSLEEPIQKLIRRAWVARCDLAAGHALATSDLALMRPGEPKATLLGAKELADPSGLTLALPLKKGEALSNEHVNLI